MSKDVATIEISDQINCRIKGLDPYSIRTMRDRLKYFQHWARHTRKYKLDAWDGYEYLFDRGGRTYINLLDQIIPELAHMGWEFEIEDHRPENNITLNPIDNQLFADRQWPKKHKLEGQPIILHDDQVVAINNYLANIQSTSILPTSFGKTIVCAALSHLTEEYGNSLVIVPSQSLVKQTEEDYKNLGLDVGVFYGNRKEIGHKHTICTWQILSALDRKRKRTKKEGAFDPELTKQLIFLFENVTTLIVDECHGAKAKDLKNLLSNYLAKAPIRWGMTGTLPKEEYERTIIKSVIGENIMDVSLKELQDKGVLANCHIDILQIQDPVEFTDFHKEMEYLSTSPSRLDLIANFIEEIRKSGNTLVLVNRVETGKELTDRIRDSNFVDGSMKVDDRKAHYDGVHDSDDAVVVATYGVAAVGISIPRIFNLVMIEIGKSFVRVVQTIGRGLRVAQDKDFVNVYDICSSCKFSKKHLTDRKKIYKEKEYKFKVTKVQV